MAAEHIRIVGDRHRWRFLLNYVDHQAGSRGFNEHDYDRADVLGGMFYEFLWPNSGASLAYAFGLPDASFVTADPNDGFELDEYSDKIIASWRYRFSQDAQLRLAASHEVSHQGFGGASLQFQMFF